MCLLVGLWIYAVLGVVVMGLWRLLLVAWVGCDTLCGLWVVLDLCGVFVCIVGFALIVLVICVLYVVLRVCFGFDCLFTWL